jgi:hypothetical protein
VPRGNVQEAPGSIRVAIFQQQLVENVCSRFPRWNR